jgi:hypothetical protein
VLAVKEFFKRLSADGDVENVQDITTPNFYNYLRGELEESVNYKPVIIMDDTNVQLWMVEPFYLLGDPRIFAEHDDCTFNRTSTDDTGINDSIVKIRSLGPQPLGFPTRWMHNQLLRTTIYHEKSCAFAAGWNYDIPIGPGPMRTWRNHCLFMWHWFQECRKFALSTAEESDPVLRRLNLSAFITHWKRAATQYPGDDDSLSIIVDIPFIVRVGNYVVERVPGKDSNERRKVVDVPMEEKQICVSMKSDPVSPGVGLNAFTVQWSIDDINYEVRKIPASEFRWSDWKV